MTTSKVIRRLMAALPAVFAQREADGRMKRSRCILATAVGIDVLRAFDIKAVPMSVQLDVLNPAWVTWVNEGKPGGQPTLMARGGYALSAGYPAGAGFTTALTEPAGWDGHLMVYLPAQAALLDLDAQQLNRPAHGIQIPVALMLKTAGDISEFDTPGGGRMFVKAKPADQSFERAPDWWDRSRRWDLVQDITRAIRKSKD